MYIQLAANQKLIHVVKAESNARNYYSVFNLAALRKAYKTLKPMSFKLWTYFNANQDGYEFALSQKAIQEIVGMSKNAYYAAVHDLIEKGYLVKVEMRENLQGYLFFEAGDGGEIVSV